ncbi:MAG: hypothetical protein HUU01_20810 [Saprospiraceae bacterium]|nr:hypothetical protein [Saprospiraceae bacterium]
MKQFFWSMVLLLAGAPLFAQQTAISIDKEAARKAADEMTALYGLNAEQAVKAYQIQERRLRNEAEIAPLKETNNLLYLQKRKAIRTGTEGSLKRMLNPSQREIFNARAMERRKRDSDFLKELKLKETPHEAMKLALLEREGNLE